MGICLLCALVLRYNKQVKAAVRISFTLNYCVAKIINKSRHFFRKGSQKYKIQTPAITAKFGQGLADFVAPSSAPVEIRQVRQKRINVFKILTAKCPGLI